MPICAIIRITNKKEAQMTIEFIIMYFGDANRTAAVAGRYGRKWTGQTIRNWQKKGGKLPVEKSRFFAEIIKSESETALKVALDVLNNGDL